MSGFSISKEVVICATVTSDDHLLTLITCDRTYGGADGRFVVMAVKED